MIDDHANGIMMQEFVRSLRDFSMILLNPDGYILQWNAGAEAIKGYKAAEVVGRHFSCFYTAQAIAVGHPERELAVAMSAGRYEEQGWRVRKDRTLFWAHVLIVPLFDGGRRLLGFGKVVRDFTAQKQTDEQAKNVLALLELTARTDYLTGIENRRSFDKELLRAMSSTRRHERRLCLAMIDLDHFKQFNDKFGHQSGDQYLKAAVSVWRSATRSEDFLARYGGEEFVVILPDTELTGGMDSMDRLRGVTPLPLTSSIGLAEWDGVETADSLIGRADHAVYLAKEAGRNRVVVAPATVLVPAQ